MNQNSLTAFKEKVKPTLTEREKAVYQVIFLYGELTTWEMALKMGKTPNQISGRFVPLEFKGFIKKAGTRQINGSTHQVWTVVTPEKKVDKDGQVNIFN